MTDDKGLQCAECAGPIAPEPIVGGPNEGVRIAWVCAVHGLQLIEDPLVP